MLTAIAVGLAGFVLAFLALFLDCGGSRPFFGEMCGHNILPSLVVLTLGAWFVLGSAVALFRSLRDNDRDTWGACRTLGIGSPSTTTCARGRTPHGVIGNLHLPKVSGTSRTR
ncbi:MAG: hypothetical protein MUF30_09910 [Burkholderiales bacterium]|nr:hypothetical protein [Burkholderiales bacterium]